ncbi:MAG: protein-methionine-sulfoxide reductase heme-binding subunit MsrQ [Vicinamibacterales bacterium]
MAGQPSSLRRSKTALFVAGLWPVAWLAWAVLRGGLGANPVATVTTETGTWTLRFLVLTLLVTPLRRLTGWQSVVRVRRMLGLFAFFYASLHFLTYLVLDQSLQFRYLAEDVARRPFIAAGFFGFLSMVPLALTSSTEMSRRLGGRRWQRLHRLVYATALAGAVHYLWLVKVDIRPPLAYGAAVVALLAIRALYWSAVLPRARRARHLPPVSAQAE